MLKIKDNQTIIRFENGDINIVTGIMLEEKIGVIAFREQTPRKISMHNGDKPEKDMNKYPVIFNFTNTDSIDVLINSLKDVKFQMENREQIIDEVEKV